MRKLIADFTPFLGAIIFLDRRRLTLTVNPIEIFSSRVYRAPKLDRSYQMIDGSLEYQHKRERRK